MKERIVSRSEISRAETNQIAARVAMFAEQADSNQKSKKDIVAEYVESRFKGDIRLENKDDVALLENMVMGTLHEIAVAKPHLAGTANYNTMKNRMGSNHRADKNPDHDYMFEAITEPVAVEVEIAGKIDIALRFQLKEDFSKALTDFHEIRKESAKREAEYNLYPSDMPMIDTAGAV